MNKLDEILDTMIKDRDGIFGVAVIDMTSRQLLGVRQTTHTLSPAALEAVAVSAVEMLRGKAVTAIETLLSVQLNTPVEHCIEEVCINTKASRIFLTSIPEKPDYLLVLCTDLSVNVAMGWMIVRRNMPQLTAEFIE